MDVTLTDESTGQTLLFQAGAESYPTSEGMGVRTWQLLEGGEVKRVNGPTTSEYSVLTFFPGGQDFGQPWAAAADWRPPIDLVFQLRTWMQDGTILRYVVTDTDIDEYVQISTMAPVWGEKDRAGYSATLIQTRRLIVQFLSSSDVPTSGETEQNKADDVGPESGPPPPDEYTVEDGDTLSLIAQKVYGQSDRWPEICEANRKAKGGPIGDAANDCNVISAGWKLKIPGGKSATPTDTQQ